MRHFFLLSVLCCGLAGCALNYKEKATDFERELNISEKTVDESEPVSDTVIFRTVNISERLVNYGKC